MANIDIKLGIRFKSDTELATLVGGEENLPKFWKNADSFQPTEGLFRLLDTDKITPETENITLYYELTERHTNGQTVRTGNKTVPRVVIEALNINLFGGGVIQNQQALAALLAAEDLEPYTPPAPVEEPENP